MDKFFEELITKTHPAVINLSVIFIILLVAYVIHIWLRSIVAVLEKNVSAQATADNLISLQKEYNGLRDYAISLREAYNQSLIIQAGIKNIHSELKHLFHQFAVGNDIQAQSYGIQKQ